MTTTLDDLGYPTPTEVRDTLLRTIQWMFQRRGLTANVLPGSDHFIRATAYANRVSVAIANGKLALTALSPLSATGDDLISLAAIFGVVPRPAAPAAGDVIVKCTGTITIPAGFTCSFSNGAVYKTTSTTTLSNGEKVAIIATVGGKDTNVGAGQKLTWTSASIGALNPVCTVATGGLVGGADADNEGTLRERLLLKLAFPGVGGNRSQVEGWAEESSASVERAYVYCAARGPGSYDVAVTRAGGDRTLAQPTLDIVEAFLTSQMPGQEDLNVTSVVAQGIDVTVTATLPLPQVAGGAGGGWLDANPWPAEDCKVVTYLSGNATIDSVAAPVVGNNIGIWDKDATDANGNPAPIMRPYVVSAVTGSSMSWVVSVQGGFAVDPTNAYVSAGAANLSAYSQEMSDQFNTLGPGEKTANPDILPRARRFPGVDVISPNAASNVLLSRVAVAHAEIEDMTYSLRVATGTSTPLTTPSIPLTTGDPPSVLVLQQLAIHA